MMKRVYPAHLLDVLYSDYLKKRTALRNLKEKVREENVNKFCPELDNEQYLALKEEVDKIGTEVDVEYDNVICAYKELFTEYYITMEEVATMFDLERIFIERHILSEVQSLYLNKYIRRYIKGMHQKGSRCELDDVIDLYEIDYEKKVFLNVKELEEWLYNHLESEDVHISRTLVKFCLSKRKNAVLHSTTSAKQLYGLKYSMQLQRLNLQRIYIRPKEDKRPISRIPDSTLINYLNSFQPLES